jgi:hypothetical protein
MIKLRSVAQESIRYRMMNEKSLSILVSNLKKLEGERYSQLLAVAESLLADRQNKNTKEKQ